MQSTLVANLRLASDLARRDLLSRHKRSALGWLWLVISPLCLMSIYTIIFGGVFGLQWHDAAGKSVGYSAPMLAGLVLYLALADMVNSSTNLFVSKRTYVVKASFPLWVIWVANLFRVAVGLAVSLALLLVILIISGQASVMGIVWSVPVLMAAALFFGATSLFLSVLGPFIGDTSEAVRLLLRALLYATPITYPLTKVPETYQPWMWLNPLTCVVEPLRQALVFGQPPNWLPFSLFVSCSSLLLLASWWMFRRVKGVITDVV